MAVKKKNNKVTKVTSEKKKKIAGLLLAVFSILLALSIISYSRYDEANLTYSFSDIFKVFSTDPDYVSRAVDTNNWMGLIGAYLSSFLIGSTLGYFSLAFPAIIFIWGFAIASSRLENERALFLTKIIFFSSLLAASFTGLIRTETGFLLPFFELSGKVGAFFGSVVGKLIGLAGGILFFLTVVFIMLFIFLDLNLHKIAEYFRNQLSDAFADDQKHDSGEEKKKKIILKKEEEKDAGEEEMISDVPGLIEEDTKETADLPEQEEADETKITIIKNEIDDNIIEAELAAAEDDKSGGDEIQDDDDYIAEINPEEEAKLPEQWEENIKYKAPGIDLLENQTEKEFIISEEELKKNAELLQQKLALFDIKVEDISVTPGPVVALYELVPAPGVKISRIVSLENDIALALAARGIRIIAPIPGKSAIGVEIPNAKASLVSARSVISRLKESKAVLPLALGKTISGDVYIADLADMPHLLIAGSTGSGKSVGINMLINSLIYSRHPSEIKFVIVDPKKIELSFYKKLSMHFLAVSPDIDEEIITTPQNALLVLNSVIYEMEKRYTKLAKVGVRNIVDYNKKVSNPKTKPKDTDNMKHFKLPYIVVVIDELADLMMTSGKEVEEPIARLAQLARAVGIHLIVATQRPSVNVITGIIKANFSARIAYQVATKIDSRTILDMNGAERLLGKGDMLFMPGGLPKPVRIQNAFISTEEVEKITNFIYIQDGFSKRYYLPSMFEQQKDTGGSMLADLDPMFEEAARVIVRHQQGSVSLLQRRLKLGYSRAARVVDQLEQAGIVGPSVGSKARDVLIDNDDQLDALLRSL